MESNYHTNIVLIEKDGNMAAASLPKVWRPHLKMLVGWGKRDIETNEEIIKIMIGE